MSRDIIREAASASGPVAVATVTGVEGSAPRHLGTMMLFRPDGSSCGTIGGGKVELETALAASRCLAEGRSSRIDVGMTGLDAGGSAPICGGRVTVSMDFVADRALYSAAAAALERGLGVVLASAVLPPGGSKPGGLLVAVLDRAGAILAGEANDVDPREAARAALAGPRVAVAAGGLSYAYVGPADRLLVLGGGHVGLALARLAPSLGFEITVGDERPEYVAPGRYPEGVTTILGDYRSIAERFRSGDSVYIVVATPSHLSDLDCARAVMGRGYRYAGFLGSRRKTRMILDRLVAEGFDRAEVEGLRAPIGIDIGAETPAEIALAILAEMVAVRRRSPALAAMDADRPRRRV